MMMIITVSNAGPGGTSCGRNAGPIVVLQRAVAVWEDASGIGQFKKQAVLQIGCRHWLSCKLLSGFFVLGNFPTVIPEGSGNWGG
jgi:hypothetical protein